MRDKTRWATAVHEAGHYVANRFCGRNDYHRAELDKDGESGRVWHMGQCPTLATMIDLSSGMVAAAHTLPQDEMEDALQDGDIILDLDGDNADGDKVYSISGEVHIQGIDYPDILAGELAIIIFGMPEVWRVTTRVARRLYRDGEIDLLQYNPKCPVWSDYPEWVQRVDGLGGWQALGFRPKK